MEIKNGVNCYYAEHRAAWRSWLMKHHESEKSVWLIIFKKLSGTPSITYTEAVEEALCFGWIDSKPNKRDGNSFYQFFAKRNPLSNWSKINKDRVQHLIQKGVMTKAGLAVIEEAKANGKWTSLDDIEKLIVPPDLQNLLRQNEKASSFFDKFPPSVKKGILEWIQNAKTKTTREKRIQQTVALAENNIRANQYQKK